MEFHWSMAKPALLILMFSYVLNNVHNNTQFAVTKDFMNKTPYNLLSMLPIPFQVLIHSSVLTAVGAIVYIMVQYAATSTLPSIAYMKDIRTYSYFLKKFLKYCAIHISVLILMLMTKLSLISDADMKSENFVKGLVSLYFRMTYFLTIIFLVN
jgi:hypothetical protein